MAAKIIFIVGYMGCGKSSLGRKLARRLACAAIDTDTEIEQQEGASVNDLFRYEGEEAFRLLEREVIERVISSGLPAVVSTGGGLPAWRDNMERMNSAGFTVYIRRSAGQIAARLSPYGRSKRPKLRGLSDEELLDFMTRNMAEREPWYSQARLVVDAGSLTDQELIQRIVRAVETE